MEPIDKFLRWSNNDCASRAIQKRIRKKGLTKADGRPKAHGETWRPETTTERPGGIFLSPRGRACLYGVSEASSGGIISFVPNFASISAASEKSLSVSAPSLCVIKRNVTLL